jgi:uncharacterized cupin superfamily protein
VSVELPLAAGSTFAWSAADVPLASVQLDPSQVIEGAPEVSEAVLWSSEDGSIVRGIWRITRGVVTDVEEDELFVVLEGSATVEIEGDDTLELSPGDVVVLARGARTRWTIHEPLRKVFQITMAD